MLDHDMALKHLRKLLKRKGLQQSEAAAIIKMVANAEQGYILEFDEYWEGLNWALAKIHKWPLARKNLITPIGEWYRHWNAGPKGRGYELHLKLDSGDEYIIQQSDWWHKKDDY